MGAIGNVLRKTGLKDRLGPSVQFLIAFIVLIWGVELVDKFTSYELDAWGIHPRSLWGLAGIPLSPLLHGGFGHLIANTIPLFVLGIIIGIRGLRNLFDVTVIIALVGGAGVWLIGSNGTPVAPKVHIGASGIVFGYFGFLIARGLFDKSVRSLLVGILVLFLYGGLIWGVLPDPGSNVSWEAHLCGLLAGALAAKMLTGRTQSIDVG